MNRRDFLQAPPGLVCVLQVLLRLASSLPSTLFEALVVPQLFQLASDPLVAVRKVRWGPHSIASGSFAVVCEVGSYAGQRI